MANVKISELNSLSKKAYNDVVPIVDTSANETKKVSIEELVNNNVNLIAVDSVAPDECVEGDKYYNTTDNLIYTATDTDTWGSTGESAIEGIFYIVFEEQTTYAYNGTTLISVGGGAGGGGDNEPIGKVVPMVLETAPEGYLLCDGSSYTKAQYPDLYKALVGTSFIVDANSFRVPDIKGKVIVGKDSTDTDFDNIGDTGGSKELQEHNHVQNLGDTNMVAGSGSHHSSTTVAGQYASNTDNANTYQQITENAGTGTSGNLQPYIVLNYFIKAQKTSGDVVLSESLPVGTEVDFDGQASDIPVGWEEVESYSTNEIKTGDTWINGKPIYRKVITGTLTSSGWNTIATNISNFDELVDLHTDIGEGEIYANNFYIGENYMCVSRIQKITNTTNLQINLGAGYVNSPFKAIIEYTKTTD